MSVSNNYSQSLYGATHDASYSIEAAAMELSIDNLYQHTSQQHIIIKKSVGSAGLLAGAAPSHESSIMSVMTHQSIDEAMYELKFRRKSTIFGTEGNSPIYRAVFNMLAGAGVVGLPVTYKNSGLAAGVVIMVLVAALSVYTLRLQVATGKKVKCEDYERLVSKCFGSAGYYFISFSILVFDVGACLTYTIILGNSARDVMVYLLGGFWGSVYGRQVVISVVYTCMILPFCLGKNFEFIERVSALAIGVVILMVIVVVTLYYNQYESMNESGPAHVNMWITSDYLDILAAIGTISFAFIQHDLAFLVYKTLKNNTMKRYSLMAGLGMAIQCVLCVTMAIYGYLSFAQNTEDDILKNYEIDNPWILAMRILYTFRMSFVFPTAFYVVRHILYAIVYRGMGTYEHAPRWKQIAFTLIPWSAFLCIGLFVDNLGFVMSLAGLVSAINIAFVIPCLCHLKVGTVYSVWFWTAPKGEKCAAFIDTFPCAILIVFGLFAGITGSVGLIAEQFY